MKKITVELTQKEAVELLGSKISNKITSKILHAIRGTVATTVRRKRKIDESKGNA